MVLQLVEAPDVEAAVRSQDSADRIPDYPEYLEQLLQASRWNTATMKRRIERLFRNPGWNSITTSA